MVYCVHLIVDDGHVNPRKDHKKEKPVTKIIVVEEDYIVIREIAVFVHVILPNPILVRGHIVRS